MIGRKKISIRLFDGCQLSKSLAKCGEAIRKEHASMINGMGRYRDRYLGASQLIAFTRDRAIYEIWLRRKEDSSL